MGGLIVKKVIILLMFLSLCCMNPMNERAEKFFQANKNNNNLNSFKGVTVYEIRNSTYIFIIDSIGAFYIAYDGQNYIVRDNPEGFNESLKGEIHKKIYGLMTFLTQNNLEGLSSDNYLLNFHLSKNNYVSKLIGSKDSLLQYLRKNYPDPTDIKHFDEKWIYFNPGYKD